VLRGSLRESDVLARLGGDEFGILLQAPAGHLRDACAATIGRLGQLLRNPVIVGELPLSVEASVGVACHPEHGDTADVLLRHADVALSEAKRDGASSAYYRPELDRHDKTRLQLLGELRRALDEHELILHYQPKLSLRDGLVQRVEALIRWAHPGRGLLPPGEFIELAEQTGLIGPLTLYAIEAALRQTQRWDVQGLRLDVAVNLSARNLSDPTFPDAVADLLDRFTDTPGRLLLELTESALIEDPTRAVAVLQQLDGLGVGLALDDFGSGYTSLASLSRLPLHQIKIDRSFVTDLVENPQHAAIVRSIIHLAHDLELEVVGEGVETAAVNSRLKQLGCDLVQGYFYTPPLPPDELSTWVRQRRTIAAVA
jgi:predicted signal transduction protein with EAL and GGDEF domain